MRWRIRVRKFTAADDSKGTKFTANGAAVYKNVITVVVVQPIRPDIADLLRLPTVRVIGMNINVESR